MKDPTIGMLRRAIREIREFYEPERAVEHLAYFTVVLYGTTTVTDEVKDIIEKEFAMSTQYIDFMTKNPLFERLLKERETKGFAEGEIEMILQLLHAHFAEATAELVELALRRVDIRDAEVIRPLKEATVKLDEQGVNKWVKDHLPVE